MKKSYSDMKKASRVNMLEKYMLTCFSRIIKPNRIVRHYIKLYAKKDLTNHPTNLGFFKTLFFLFFVKRHNIKAEKELNKMISQYRNGSITKYKFERKEIKDEE